MTKADMGRKMRAALIVSEMRPSEACTKRDSSVLDVRRWDGRSADACLKTWCAFAGNARYSADTAPELWR